MRLSRRAMLGAALGGGSLAVLGGLPAWATGAGPSAALVLVDPSVPPETRKTLGGGRVLTVTGPQTLAEAAGWLAAAPGRRVSGLLSHGDGILFQQMVPRGRGRWLPVSHLAPRTKLMSFVVAGS